MNFRTLIMLAVAALVIVVAVKMNRNPMPDPTENPTANLSTSVIPDTSAPVEDTVMTEEEASGLVYDDMDGTVDAPAATPTEMEAVAEGDTATPADVTDETYVGDEPVTEEEADALAPAAVGESPAEALETGPAEDISEEPITPSSEKPEMLE